MSLGLLIAQSDLDLKSAGKPDQCVADNGVCPNWIFDHLNDYVSPFIEHAWLTAITVVAGFVISFTLAIIAHRQRWLTGPITTTTGILYAIPSVGAFILLQAVFGRGNFPGVFAVTAYSLYIIFRNTTLGLRNVPRETVDAARGMGLTARQVLWRVELPLALPEVFAGLRIAATTNVGLLTLATFIGAGGLGQFFSDKDQLSFQSNVLTAGVACLILAAAFDIVLLLAQRLSTPWMRAAR